MKVKNVYAVEVEKTSRVLLLVVADDKKEAEENARLLAKHSDFDDARFEITDIEGV